VAKSGRAAGRGMTGAGVRIVLAEKFTVVPAPSGKSNRSVIE